MKRLIPILILCVALAGCGAKDDAKSQANKSEKSEASKPDASDDDGPGVTLKADAQARARIRVQALEESDAPAVYIAYGKFEEDPNTSFTVRAPVAGTLRSQNWPALGQKLTAHSVAGQIETRLAVSDRLTLNTQVAGARADLKSAQAAAAAAQAAYNRAKSLNSDNKNVSDRVVEEALAKVTAEQTREAGLRSLLQSLEGSMVSSEPRAVMVERAGDVVEVLAQPGESVEQGAPLFRLTQLDHLLARLELPVGERLPGNTARLTAAGYEAQAPMTAQPVAPLLFRPERTLAGIRPGMPVTARFALPGRSGPGKSKEAILIPRSAIVQQDGRLWVYVQTKDDRFTRKPVPLDNPTPAGYLATRGFETGDKLVISGAQTLLSEEFKSKNEADTN